MNPGSNDGTKAASRPSKRSHSKIKGGSGDLDDGVRQAAVPLGGPRASGP
ncbi:unnamed protein product, partial [Heterosigma akashiwo]